MSERKRLGYVFNKELNTLFNTDQRMGGAVDIFEEAIDFFIYLTTLIKGEDENLKSDIINFEYLASMHYYQAPYSFTAVYSLWKRGYYYESAIVLRNLLEGLVVIHYFEDRKDKIESYFKEPLKYRIKDMFNTCAPGLYDHTYMQLSDFAHGGLSKELFRTEKEDMKDRKVIIGSEYSDFKASYVANIYNALMLGYYIYYPKCFSRFDVIYSDQEIMAEYQINISNMKSAIESHKKSFPQSKEWYEKLAPLIS